jgi:cell division protease FtsH
MRTCLFLFFIQITTGFLQKPYNHRTNTALHLSNSELPNKIIEAQYRELLQKESFGDLLNEIDQGKIEQIYISDDMRKTIAKRMDSEISDNLDTIYDYSITTSTPSLTNIIVEHANSKKVNTIILSPPINPYAQFGAIISYAFDFILVSSILFTIGRIIFSGMNQQNNMGGGMPPMMMPFMNNNNFKETTLNPNITLSSWAGSPEIFNECTEIVSYLKNSTMYLEAGATVPKGILLEGPPGTGKTLIAKAIASEAEATFISVAASEFVELFVGMGASKVRNLFQEARENAPTIIFIDEIDAVGKQRGTGINMGNDEREQTLNQLLSEMDGFESNDNILVIAATNRRDVLDAALLRPGRFDRIINIPLPDKPSRKSILEVHLQNKKIDENISLDFLAETTSGFSGAELKNLVNEAAIHAVREGKTTISQTNLEDALEKLIVGIVKKIDTRSDDARLRVAIHEIGHAFLAAYFKNYFQLKKVTIQTTYNGAGGYTLFNEYPEITESGLYTKDMLQKRIIVALGGKAAETIYYDKQYVSVGAIQDLKQANAIAREMVGNYGMGNKLEVFYNENTESGRNPFLGRSLGMGDKYSEKTKEEFDKEVLDIVNAAYIDAIEILSYHKPNIDILAHMLLSSITLDGEFVKDYITSVTDFEE